MGLMQTKSLDEFLHSEFLIVLFKSKNFFDVYYTFITEYDRLKNIYGNNFNSQLEKLSYEEFSFYLNTFTPFLSAFKTCFNPNDFEDRIDLSTEEICTIYKYNCEILDLSINIYDYSEFIKSEISYLKEVKEDYTSVINIPGENLSDEMIYIWLSNVNVINEDNIYFVVNNFNRITGMLGIDTYGKFLNMLYEYTNKIELSNPISGKLFNKVFNICRTNINYLSILNCLIKREIIPKDINVLKSLIDLLKNNVSFYDFPSSVQMILFDAWFAKEPDILYDLDYSNNNIIISNQIDISILNSEKVANIIINIFINNFGYHTEDGITIDRIENIVKNSRISENNYLKKFIFDEKVKYKFNLYEKKYRRNVYSWNDILGDISIYFKNEDHINDTFINKFSSLFSYNFIDSLNNIELISKFIPENSLSDNLKNMIIKTINVDNYKEFSNVKWTFILKHIKELIIQKAEKESNDIIKSKIEKDTYNDINSSLYLQQFITSILDSLPISDDLLNNVDLILDDYLPMSEDIRDLGKIDYRLVIKYIIDNLNEIVDYYDDIPSKNSLKAIINAYEHYIKNFHSYFNINDEEEVTLNKNDKYKIVFAKNVAGNYPLQRQLEDLCNKTPECVNVLSKLFNSLLDNEININNPVVFKKLSSNDKLGDVWEVKYRKGDFNFRVFCYKLPNNVLYLTDVIIKKDNSSRNVYENLANRLSSVYDDYSLCKKEDYKDELESRINDTEDYIRNFFLREDIYENNISRR